MSWTKARQAHAPNTFDGIEYGHGCGWLFPQPLKFVEDYLSLMVRCTVNWINYSEPLGVVPTKRCTSDWVNDFLLAKECHLSEYPVSLSNVFSFTVKEKQTI